MAIGSRSSAAGLHPAWVRWLVPSAGDVLFVVLLSLLVFTPLSVRLLGDAGIGWHMRTGQLILATREIPRADPFSPMTSSVTSGQPWFAWEWLYDVVVGWLDSAAGLNGVVLFTALIIAGLFAWTFRLLLRRGTNVLVALVLVLLAESGAMIHVLARPHVVSWLFTVAWFWILESAEKRCAGSHFASSPSHSDSQRSWQLWLLPLLMVVWVNVHGGFLVGFALLAIYWFGAVWQWFGLKGDRFEDILQKIRAGRRAWALTFTGLVSAAATLVNPYGFRLQVHIYRYLSNRFLMDHIDEFQSPNFHYVAQKCFAGVLLLTLVALAAKRREASASQSLVMLFAVYSGLYASRNIPVSSLLLILVIGPWLSHGMERLADRQTLVRWRRLASTSFLQRMKVIELSLSGHLWPIAAIVLTCWIAAQGGKLGARPLMDAHFDAKRFPVYAVDYLEKQDVQGPLVSPDYWGGYLIYRLYPRVRMVVDDRHDFYGEAFVKSYLKMMHVEPGWEDFLQQHPAHGAVVPKDSALANILVETPGWQPIYSDDVAVVFVRTPARRK
ncbi:MAG: hypothetical protein WCA20_35990 [Candidatus Sulfotelmatobacter sp.]